MQKFNFYSNILLLIGVAVLFIFHFTGSPSVDGQLNTLQAGKDSLGFSGIVYVNTDSLLENYDYFKEMRTSFEKKNKDAEADLMRRQNALQNELQKYQQTGGAMSMEQRQATEEGLMKKDQELREYGQKVALKLQEEETKFNDELLLKVTEYLKEYSKGKNYQVILSYSKGSNILFANDQLNITQEVIKGLNESGK